jgi:hypothetical protein
MMMNIIGRFKNRIKDKWGREMCQIKRPRDTGGEKCVKLNVPATHGERNVSN